MAFYLQAGCQVVLENTKPMAFRLLEQNTDHLHQTVQIRGPSSAGLWITGHRAFKQGVVQTGHTQPGERKWVCNPICGRNGCKDVCRASLEVLVLCISGGTAWCSGWKTIIHHVPLRIGISNVRGGAAGLGQGLSSRNEIAALELQPEQGGASGCSYECPAPSM